MEGWREGIWEGEGAGEGGSMQTRAQRAGPARDFAAARATRPLRTRARADPAGPAPG
jgi:hypothetical protein